MFICIPRGSNARAAPICIPRSSNACAAPVVVPTVEFRSEWVESFDARTSELADGGLPFAWLLNGGNSVR